MPPARVRNGGSTGSPACLRSAAPGQAERRLPTPPCRADADAVYDPQRWPAERVPLRSPITVGELEALQFEAGSMKPKVEAAISFVRASGGRAAIGHIADAADILRGTKGTLVVPDGQAV